MTASGDQAARFDSAEIRRYYDTHTGAFLGYGQGGAIGAIHRAVWGPGVATREQAFRFVESRIAAAIDRLPGIGPHHVVDLGCGVGASLCYLAQARPIVGTGITLSPAQAALARQRIEGAGLSARVRCLEGDFGALPGELGPANLIFAIESFVHGSDPSRFFAECARTLVPGGTLIICDDFTRSIDPGDAAEAEAAIERFRRGWHVNTLIPVEALTSLAAAAGFSPSSTTDLTPWLELDRFRDHLIEATLRPLGSLAWRWPRLHPLVGGSALRRALKRGWVAYCVVELRLEPKA